MRKNIIIICLLLLIVLAGDDPRKEIKREYSPAGKADPFIHEYYPGGEKRSEYQVEENLIKGPLKEFYPSGKVRSIGQYVNGVRTGKIGRAACRERV